MTVKAFNTSDVPRFRRVVTVLFEYIDLNKYIGSQNIWLLKCNKFEFITFVSPLALAIKRTCLLEYAPFMLR